MRILGGEIGLYGWTEVRGLVLVPVRLHENLLHLVDFQFVLGCLYVEVGYHCVESILRKTEVVKVLVPFLKLSREVL